MPARKRKRSAQNARSYHRYGPRRASPPSSARYTEPVYRRRQPISFNSLLLFALIVGLCVYLGISQGWLGGLTGLITSLKTSPPVPQVERISQVDPGQYNDRFPEHTWWKASCSAATMAEVMNRYGHAYRIADVLKVEVQLGVISPDLGLLKSEGIDETVAQFGFHATWLQNATIEQVIQFANTGKPVIVDIPPAKAGQLYPGGHFLVVTGGSQNRVDTVDSSTLNITTWTLGQPRDPNAYDLLDYYSGLAVLIEPAGAS